MYTKQKSALFLLVDLRAHCFELKCTTTRLQFEIINLAICILFGKFFFFFVNIVVDLILHTLAMRCSYYFFSLSSSYFSYLNFALALTNLSTRNLFALKTQYTFTFFFFEIWFADVSVLHICILVNQMKFGSHVRCYEYDSNWFYLSRVKMRQQFKLTHKRKILCAYEVATKTLKKVEKNHPNWNEKKRTRLFFFL